MIINNQIHNLASPILIKLEGGMNVDLYQDFGNHVDAYACKSVRSSLLATSKMPKMTKKPYRKKCVGI